MRGDILVVGCPGLKLVQFHGATVLIINGKQAGLQANIVNRPISTPTLFCY